jgi:hypothetical protein
MDNRTRTGWNQNQNQKDGKTGRRMKTGPNLPFSSHVLQNATKVPHLTLTYNLLYPGHRPKGDIYSTVNPPPTTLPSPPTDRPGSHHSTRDRHTHYFDPAAAASPSDVCSAVVQEVMRACVNACVQFAYLVLVVLNTLTPSSAKVNRGCAGRGPLGVVLHCTIHSHTLLSTPRELDISPPPVHPRHAPSLPLGTNGPKLRGRRPTEVPPLSIPSSACSQLHPWPKNDHECDRRSGGGIVQSGGCGRVELWESSIARLQPETRGWVELGGEGREVELKWSGVEWSRVGSWTVWGVS